MIDYNILIKFLCCLIPLLILWGISYLLKQKKLDVLIGKKNNFFQVLESLNLGLNHSLYLIQVGEDKIILLSVSQTGSQILETYKNTDLKTLTPKESENKSNSLK